MRTSDQNRKRHRENKDHASILLRFFSDNSYGIRMFCLLMLCHVVFSAYHYHNVYKNARALSYGSSSSLQFASNGAAIHQPLNSALHVSFAETSQSTSASHPAPPQETTIESTGQTDVNPLNVDGGILPEWSLFSDSAKSELQQILHWTKVTTFDYPDIFRLDELTQGHSLLFMSWAILASPDSQKRIVESQDTANAEHTNLLHTFGIVPSTFLNYVRAIEQGYKNNPYHNHIHAADVLQTLHSLLVSEEGMRSKLTRLQHLSLLLAAISHDVGHDGTNNEFQVQTQSDLAIQYQNVSVLENYHAEVGLRELEASGMLKHLPLEQQEEIRNRISEAILHTDMSKHRDQVQAYKQMDDWERGMYLLHLCDISNPTKSSSLIWVEHVLEEFYQIGELQKSLGLPVTPMCDRISADKVSTQRGFLQYLVLPAFEEVEFSNPKIMEHLYANYEYWMQQ
ncbi:MAG: hypothetical protein SGBAC_013578 [Bacillariaceae sp.]